MKRLLIPAAIAAVALVPGTASANTPEPPRYDCAGVTFVMPRTEDGTTITVTRNGTPERTVENSVFGARVAISVPSPDQSVQQSWRITVAGYNGTQVYTGTVAPCVSATTVAATTTTAVPASSTTTAPPTSTVPSTTVVAVTTPPVVPSTTVVQPPRSTLPVSSSPVTPTLPATGSALVEVFAFVGGMAIAVGTALLIGRRRQGRAS